MKKRTKGILIGCAVLGVIGTVLSPDEADDLASNTSLAPEVTEVAELPIESEIPTDLDDSKVSYAPTEPEEPTASDESAESEESPVSDAPTEPEKSTASEASVEPEESTASDASVEPEESTASEASVAPEESTASEAPTEPEETTVSEAPAEPEETTASVMPANSEAPSSNGSNFNTYDNAEQQNTEDTYVLNTDRMKIHYPSCSSVKKIAPENYATSSSTIDELISQGYSTCGNCFR